MEINALEIFNKVYPVGSIYLSVNNSNPSNYFGGTWVAWGAGRFPMGVDIYDQSDYFTDSEMTGGSDEITVTIDNMPSHTHTTAGGDRYVLKPTGGSQEFGVSGSVSIKLELNSTGGGKPIYYLPKYITCYMWKRTA